MRLGHAFGIALLAIAPCTACSLLTPLDGLTGGGGPSLDGGAGDGAGGGDAGASDGAGGSDAAGGGPDGAITACGGPGLVAAWLFEEGAGDLVHDCTGAKVDGSRGGTTGSVLWGKRGSSTCLEINGPSAPITMGRRSELALAGPFTVAGWMRSDDATDHFVSLAWRFDGKGFEITLDSLGNLYAQIGLSNATAVKLQYPRLTPGTWTHLAAVFEPGIRFELFADGVSVKKRTDLTSPPSLTAASQDFRIGVLGDGTTWRGGIDDVRIYARALADAEIAELAKP